MDACSNKWQNSAEENGADIEVVEHFALIHDVMREDENLDLYHGPRAADLGMIAGTWIELNERKLHQLMNAMSIPFSG